MGIYTKHYPPPILFTWISAPVNILALDLKTDNHLWKVKKIGFQRHSGFESCIQQRKTTCHLSIRKSLACARASKLSQQQICISPEPGANAKWQWGRVCWMLAGHRNRLSSSSLLAWYSIAHSVCQQAFSLLAIGFQRPAGFESCI